MEWDKSLGTAGGSTLQTVVGIFAGVKMFVVFYLLLLSLLFHILTLHMFSVLQENMYDPLGEVMAHFHTTIAEAHTGHTGDVGTCVILDSSSAQASKSCF